MVRLSFVSTTAHFIKDHIGSALENSLAGPFRVGDHSEIGPLVPAGFHEAKKGLAVEAAFAVEEPRGAGHPGKKRGNGCADDHHVPSQIGRAPADGLVHKKVGPAPVVAQVDNPSLGRRNRHLLRELGAIESNAQDVAEMTRHRKLVDGGWLILGGHKSHTFINMFLMAHIDDADLSHTNIYFFEVVDIATQVPATKS